MKLVILDGYCLNPGDLSWAGLEALGELTVYDRTPLDDEDEIVSRVGDCEIVLTNKTPLSRSVLDRCPQVRYIGLLATGYNVVDVDAARERGVPVCNVPGYGTSSVAQFAIALLLEICCRVGHHDQAVHQGRWSACPDYCFWDYPLVELAGKTMGIVGFGSIGQAVGRIAGALGRASRGAQLMWGVMRQFLAVSRGLSAGMGSASATSTPAARSLPLLRASATSRSTMRGPRLLLSRMAPSFILPMVSRLMRPRVSGNRGQWRLTTSLRASSASRGTQGAGRVPSAQAPWRPGGACWTRWWRT